MSIETSVPCKKISAEEPTLKEAELQKRIVAKVLEATVNRARRAINDLIDTEYLTFKCQCKIKDEGHYKGLTIILVYLRINISVFLKTWKLMGTKFIRCANANVNN